MDLFRSDILNLNYTKLSLKIFILICSEWMIWMKRIKILVMFVWVWVHYTSLDRYECLKMNYIEFIIWHKQISWYCFFFRIKRSINQLCYILWGFIFTSMISWLHVFKICCIILVLIETNNKFLNLCIILDITEELFMCINYYMRRLIPKLV